jgi:hypothetical protein
MGALDGFNKNINLLIIPLILVLLFVPLSEAGFLGWLKKIFGNNGTGKTRDYSSFPVLPY